MKNHYSARVSSHATDEIDAFCHWIRGQTSSFEEIPISHDEQLFRFKIKSRRRRTGMVVKKNSGKIVLVGAAGFHFEQFTKTWGHVCER